MIFAKSNQVNRVLRFLVLTATLAASSLLSLSSALAQSEQSLSPSSYLPPQEITDYKIDIAVDQAKHHHIIEEITLQFNQPKHGLLRKIPLRSKLYRQTGHSIVENIEYAKVSNLKVNHQFTKNTENDLLTLKIGDPKQTVTGKYTYRIEYDYYTHSFHPIHNQEFYFNVVGSQWDIPIKKIDFRIKLPKPVDPSKLGLNLGSSGSTGYQPNKAFYFLNSDSQTITGSAFNLKPREAATVRASFGEDYFIYQSLLNIRVALSFIISVAALIVATILYFTQRRKKPTIVEQVSFYPPKNMSVAEIALAYSGNLSQSDIPAILIQLANQGYIRIEEGKKPRFGAADFTIFKIKQYDGNDKAEQIFFNGLFKDARPNKKGEYYVKKDDLALTFYKEAEKIYAHLNNPSKLKNYFQYYQNLKILRIFTTILFLQSLLSFIWFLLPGAGENFILYIFYSIIVTSTAYSIAKNTHNINFIRSFFTSLRGIIIMIGIIMVLILFPGFGALFPDIWPSIKAPAIFSFVTSAIVFFYMVNSKIRTQYGAEVVGEILGFRRFLEIARKDELEKLVAKTPTYFYDILPYTYILGLSLQWIKKFKTITIPPANWYNSQNSYNSAYFASNISKNLNSISNAINTSPSSSSSGGGGFSGGGSGGGGGGSW